MKTKTDKHKNDSFEDKLKQIDAPAAGALTYNGYLMVNELKSLQVCQSDPAHHDEPLFIIIHQTYELWFKLVLHELDAVFDMLSQDKVRRATFYMRRVIAIFKLLVQQIHILETMQPRDFLGFRYNLSPASGFGSSQFREIEFACGLKLQALLDHFRADPAYTTLKSRFDSPSLNEAFYGLLRRKGFVLPEPTEGMKAEQVEKLQAERIKELLKLYNDEDAYGDLHDLAEALIELDETLHFWRAHHAIVVERIIGFKRGTGGSEGVGYLQSTLTKRCFPDLWQLRTAIEPEGGPVASEKAPASPTSGGGCPFGHG